MEREGDEEEGMNRLGEETAREKSNEEGIRGDKDTDREARRRRQEQIKDKGRRMKNKNKSTAKNQE